MADLQGESSDLPPLILQCPGICKIYIPELATPWNGQVRNLPQPKNGNEQFGTHSLSQLKKVTLVIRKVVSALHTL